MEQGTITTRLKEYLNLKGWTAKEFEKIIGLGNGTAARLSESTRKSTYDRISNKTDLNTEWLRTGEGDMIKPKSEFSNAKMVGGVYQAEPRDTESLMVDFVPISAMASFAENLANGFVVELEKIPLIPMGNERNELDKLRDFEVEGDSMFPTIPSGSLILAKEIPSNSWHYAEGVVVAVYNEFVVVKRIARNCLLSDNYLVLKSDNEGYGEMVVELADIRGLFKAKRIISSEIR